MWFELSWGCGCCGGGVWCCVSRHGADWGGRHGGISTNTHAHKHVPSTMDWALTAVQRRQGAVKGRRHVWYGVITCEAMGTRQSRQSTNPTTQPIPPIHTHPPLLPTASTYPHPRTHPRTLLRLAPADRPPRNRSRHGHGGPRPTPRRRRQQRRGGGGGGKEEAAVVVKRPADHCGCGGCGWWSEAGAAVVEVWVRSPTARRLLFVGLVWGV